MRARWLSIQAVSIKRVMVKDLDHDSEKIRESQHSPVREEIYETMEQKISRFNDLIRKAELPRKTDKKKLKQYFLKLYYLKF